MGAVGTAPTAAEGSRGEAQLVERVRKGNDGAFEELYRRYQHRIRNFVANRVGDPARAEDLTQEAFMSALRGLRTTDAEIAWKPWLYEIARNVTIDFHRRRRNNEVPVHHEELMRPLDRRRLVASRGLETELDLKERLDHLRGAFDELPPNHHRVLVMREFEGLSYREIAERLNLTHAAVESKLFRACRRHARGLGVDPFGRRRWQSRVAALSPLGWLLRRPPVAPSQPAEALLGNGGQLGAGLAEQGVALVTAAALACAGSLSLGSAPRPTPAVPKAVVAAAAPRASSVPSGVTGARLRGRRAAPESRHARVSIGPPVRTRARMHRQRPSRRLDRKPRHHRFRDRGSRPRWMASQRRSCRT